MENETSHSEEPILPFDEPEVKKEQFPLLVKMVFLGLCFTLSAFIGMAFILLFGKIWDFDFMTILYDEATYETASGRNKIRLSLGVNHLTSFVIPPMVFCWFFYRSKWSEYLKLKQLPDSVNVMMGTLFMMAVMPVAQLAMWLNKKIPLPEWMRTMEDQTSTLIANMLQADASYEFMLNLLVVAVLPAIGEELLFRGVLQQQFEKHMKNGILAIWITAAIFSAFHMQFEGFFARMVLGAALGYLFYWSRNLWVPIIAHFLNNGLQVFAAYFFMDDMEKLQEQTADQSPLALGVVGIVMVYFLGRYLFNYNKNRIA